MKCHIIAPLLCLTPAELSATERAQVEEHLAACAVCRRAREEQQRLDAAIRARVARIPIAGAHQVRARLRSRRTILRIWLMRLAAGCWHAARAVASPAAGMTVAGLLIWWLIILWPSGTTPAPERLHEQPASGALRAGNDQVWIERTTPPAGAILSGEVRFTVELGYRLASAPEGLLSLRVVDVPDGQIRYFSPPARVVAGDERATIRFTLDVERARAMFGPGSVQLEATLRALDGTGESRLLAQEIFATTRFTIP